MAGTRRPSDFGKMRLLGRTEIINSVEIRDYMEDINRNITYSSGLTVPTDGSSGYAVGSLFAKTNGSLGTALYVNEGTATSSDFNPVVTSSTNNIKSVLVVYDFAVDGGVAGTIALTGAPTIPDNAVVVVESYDVITTSTSATDAATIALQLPTDGTLTTAIAISAGSNPWDAGVYSRIAGALATPLTRKTTAARVPSLLVAGGENLTAGKIIFQLSYWISQ